MSPREWRDRRLHLLGVGGAGMSAYARAARALGAVVSGSDANETPYSERLRADGVLEATIGYRPDHLPPGGDVEVFCSSAIRPDNPELLAARERGLSVHPRAVLLGELTAERRTIAVAGTHGKTTTASMIAHALREAGMDPGWLIGATIGGDLPNAHWGGGEWLVVEADESDRSMLSLDVEIAVLTNVELDHHSSYPSLAQLRQAFAAFLSRARDATIVWDRPECSGLIGGERETIRYELPEVTPAAGGSRFQWRGHDVRLSVPGEHNVLNAIAALEAARLAGAREQSAIAGLAGFHGAGRRFQPLGRSAAGALVYDDYAHHPTEVRETLRAARTLGPERLTAVFQPHLYSRTAQLARDFGVALALADVVVVLEVYPARERSEDHPGVSGLSVVRAVTEAAPGRPVYWLPDMRAAESLLAGMLGEGDLCLVMGAGDVDRLGWALVDDERHRGRRATSRSPDGAEEAG